MARLYKNNGEIVSKILDEISDGVLIARQDDKRFVYANNTICRMLGYSEDELLKLGVDDIHPKESLDDVYQEISMQVQGKKLIAKELPIKRKDGSIFFGEISSVPIEIEDTQFVIGCFRDVTERITLEKEIERSQKLESLGILAGGIAHDFNNILTAIMGNINLALDSYNREEWTQYLKDAEKAIKRAKNLTHQLLTFAKGGDPVKETASIKEVIIESANFILTGSKVICEYDIPENLWLVDIDKGQISQVIQNLILNAVEAMPSGGVIRVKAEDKFVKFDLNSNLMEDKNGKSRYVKISIIDEGIGIKKEELSKIFDPFYTTKGKGSGLGLAVVYSIIKKHQGYIRVKSELGVGSQFDLYLPASSSFVECADDDEASLENNDVKILCEGGKVLIVDDDEAIRKILGNMLSKFGFQSEFAEDGHEAIKMYKKCYYSNLKYNFIILDLTIPGKMGGRETIKQILMIDPDVKAIISSGYSNDPVIMEYEKYGFKGVLKKPYSIEELKRVVEKIL